MRESTEPKLRVTKVAQAIPDCQCENHPASEYSPGVVSNGERLARFVFSPIHINKKGRILPTLFSHVNTQGCSIQREDMATIPELMTFVGKFLDGAADRKWHGVAVARCEEIRNIIDDEQNKRLFCVYDTSEKDNPAHAEIFRAYPADDDNGDQNELRARLMEAFCQPNLISPEAYLKGAIAQGIEPSRLGSE